MPSSFAAAAVAGVLHFDGRTNSYGWMQVAGTIIRAMGREHTITLQETYFKAIGWTVTNMAQAPTSIRCNIVLEGNLCPLHCMAKQVRRAQACTGYVGQMLLCIQART